MWGTFANSCVLCMEVVQSIGAPLDAGFRELRLQEVEKRSCMIDRGLREQEASWYREGMHALDSRWRKAVDVDGDSFILSLVFSLRDRVGRNQSPVM